MNRRDEWGRDPSVHAMRGVFGLMESFQDRFIEQAGIDRYDSRLRAWRERAKRGFEQSRAKAAGNRIQLRPEQAAALYLQCLADVMRADGVLIPNDALVANSASRSPHNGETNQ
jgi:hypothetical protein